jgi:hypothetical protein
MKDRLVLNCGIAITLSTVKGGVTTIDWAPKPPYTTEQIREISTKAWPWIMANVANVQGDRVLGA